MIMISQEVISHAEKIRDYMKLKQRPWDEKNITVVSKSTGYLDYRKRPIDDEFLINFLVWDLDRIIKYPHSPYEYQIFQEVPAEVMGAFDVLKNSWFTKRLLPK